MALRLFISYRRSHLAQVRPAVEALRAAGIDCFFDLDAIDALADFPERIRQGIAESHALLAWWSRDYGESDHCLAELKLAWQHARRQSSDVGRRVWVLNPEPNGDHVFAGDLNARNFLRPPEVGAESAWAQALLARLEPLLPEGTLASERQAAPSPTLFNVPNPPNEFTGRTAEMLRIHGKLHPPQISGTGRAPAVQTHGLGGIGKTTLAAKYAHDFAYAYPGGIVWLNLAGYEPGSPARREAAEHAWYKAVEATFRGESELLYDAEGKPRPAIQVRRLLEQRFSGPHPSLWVLDNVPVLLPETERDAILAFWRAPASSGRTLVTTRDSRTADGFTEEPLDVLGEDDALRLLARYRRQTVEETSIARELVRKVGAHSLALALLGEQLRDAPGGYARARDRLQETGLLERIEAIAAELSAELGDKARGIIATFAVSLEPLDQDAQVALALAAVCAPGEPIPAGLLAEAFSTVNRMAAESRLRRWLRRWLPFFGPAPGREDARAFVPALRRLLRASLLTRRYAEGSDDDSVVIHPLVAEAALRLLEVERKDVAEFVAAALVSRIEAAAADVHCHPRLGADIGQARHLIATLESESTVWLATWVGRFEGARGFYAQERILEERAQDVGCRLLGEEHPATIIALTNLAGTLQALGDLAAARELQEHALAVLRKYLAEDDVTALSALDNLGTMLHDQGKLAEARELHERTLAARRRVLGEEDPQTLFSMNNLAQVLHGQGEVAAARSLTEHTLEVSRRVLGEEHPDTLRLMSNLALNLHALGESAAARALNESTLELYRRRLGEDHPDTLRVMGNLAVILDAQGDLPAARSLGESAFASNRRVLGEEHPTTLLSAWNLLETLRQLADDDAVRNLLATSALGRLPELPDASMPPGLCGKKPEVAALRKALLGQPGPPNESSPL